jgi:hypothetical protein
MIDQVYCIRDYWLDYPRKDRVRIDNIQGISNSEKQEIRSGKSVSASDRGGTYTQTYFPIHYDNIED